MSFKKLTLTDSLLKAVKDAGYETPSPIQEKAIPPVLEGRDLLGCAQTGTGKTAAFALPILQRLASVPAPKKPVIRTLVLTPTRELALQIQESFETYSKYLPLRSTVVFGGVGQNPQVLALRRGVDILVATPGRLLDLINQGHIKLQHLEIFVLDEADRMLDMGFVQDVKKVIRLIPKKRQTLLFSATMPKEIAELANQLLHRPAKVFVTPVSSTVESIEQRVYHVEKRDKKYLLAHLLRAEKAKSALVFTRTKHGADRVVRELSKAGIKAKAIHGNKSQNARQDALARLKDGRVGVLVATDIAARGLDISELSHVFNYDLPNIPETYVHRIGRTGRAGRGGVALSFCMPEEREYLYDIETLIGFQVPVVEQHAWAVPVAAAQKPKAASAAEKKGSKDSRGQSRNEDVAAARQREKNPRQKEKRTVSQKPVGEPPAGPKKGATGAGRQRGADRQKGLDPYENRGAGKEIVTRRPIWGALTKTPASSAQHKDSEGDAEMSRGRKRGNRNRGKQKKQAGEQEAKKQGAQGAEIPKDKNGLFHFSDEELAKDDSLRLISTNDSSEPKYANFEDYLKDH
ncbi:DEAD/DEAH box helicase [Ruminococcaceae bacterium OttesenSCG-928-I18]|nr:DEAD/DEAH box helicase [Ruminococcaceae bacterium OttesenSCG-928-I18]